MAKDHQLGQTPSISAVSFDVVGTFLHVAEPVSTTYARFGRLHGLDTNPARIGARMVRALADLPPMAPHSNNSASCEFAWWRRLAAQALASHPDNPAFAACFEELFAYFAKPAAWRLNHSFAGLLDTLEAGGLKLAIISNFDGRLHALLDAFGLSTRFDAVALPRHAGCAKPQAGIFLYAVRALGVASSRVLHVGNHVGEDFEGAQRAGLQAMIWQFPARGGERSRVQLLTRLSQRVRA